MHHSHNNTEKRCFFHEETRAKVVNEESRTIRGYGIVFNKESVDLRASNGMLFREVIRPEAVDGVPLDNILSMHNHRSERLLGNTRSNTMRVGVDSVGVWYEVDLPNSPTGQDVYESVKRGDTQGSSFQFDIKSDGERVTKRNGKAFREIIKFNGVYEMGPVSEPAYPDTSIAARSLEAMEALFESRDGGEDGGGDGSTPEDPMEELDTSVMAEKGYSLALSASSIQNMNWVIGDCDYRASQLSDLKDIDPQNAAKYTAIQTLCKTAREALKNIIAAEADLILAVNAQRSVEKKPEASAVYFADMEDYF